MASLCLQASAAAPFTLVKRVHRVKAAVGARKPLTVRCVAEEASQAPRSRRDALAGAASLFAFSAISAPEAQAANALATYWKGRQRAASAKLIAPVLVSRDRLEQAAARLKGTPSQGDYLAALEIVRMASCNCYVYDAFTGKESFDTKASLFTSKLSVADNCTFRLIIKNITGLFPDDAPTKVKAYDTLQKTINDFSLLDDFLDRAASGDKEGVEKAPKLLETVLEDTRLLEAVIYECLDAEPFENK